MLFGPEAVPDAPSPDVMLTLDAEAAPACDEDGPRRLFGIAFCTLACRFMRCSDLESRKKKRVGVSS